MDAKLVLEAYDILKDNDSDPCEAVVILARKYPELYPYQISFAVDRAWQYDLKSNSRPNSLLKIAAYLIGQCL